MVSGSATVKNGGRAQIDRLEDRPIIVSGLLNRVGIGHVCTGSAVNRPIGHADWARRPSSDRSRQKQG
jgi:hypothetical protein